MRSSCQIGYRQIRQISPIRYSSLEKENNQQFEKSNWLWNLHDYCLKWIESIFLASRFDMERDISIYPIAIISFCL